MKKERKKVKRDGAADKHVADDSIDSKSRDVTESRTKVETVEDTQQHQLTDESSVKANETSDTVQGDSENQQSNKERDEFQDLTAPGQDQQDYVKDNTSDDTPKEHTQQTNRDTSIDLSGEIEPSLTGDASADLETEVKSKQIDPTDPDQANSINNIEYESASDQNQSTVEEKSGPTTVETEAVIEENEDPDSSECNSTPIEEETNNRAAEETEERQASNGVHVEDSTTKDKEEIESSALSQTEVQPEVVSENPEVIPEKTDAQAEEAPETNNSPKEAQADSTVTEGAEVPAEPNQTMETVEPPKTEPEKKKPVRKRLTLQERLAQAAKGKAKKTAKSQSPSVEPASNPAASIPIAVPPPVEENLENEPIEKSESTISTNSVELPVRVETPKIIQPSISISSDLFEKERQELLAKIAKQESTIKELREEGELLSHKELKLNDTIKKLKLTNQQLEENLQDYLVKSDDSNLKLQELQDFLRVNKFKSLDQFREKYGEISNRLSSTTEQLEQSSDLQQKYNDLVSVHEEQIASNKLVVKDFNDLKIQVDIMKSQHSLELDSKDNIIQDLKHDLIFAKQSYTSEISRLEDKIENLRLEQESDGYEIFNTMSNIPTSSHNSNIQLVNKMSSTIRRLEIELHTLKDEYTKLNQDKEKLEQELFESIKLNDEMSLLTVEIDELKQEIVEKEKKEQTMLELIGEKSEQVEELKADVVDLKDLYIIWSTTTYTNKKKRSSNSKEVGQEDTLIVLDSNGDLIVLSPLSNKEIKRYSTKAECSRLIKADNFIWIMGNKEVIKYSSEDDTVSKIQIPSDTKIVEVLSGKTPHFVLSDGAKVSVGKIVKHKFVKEHEVDIADAKQIVQSKSHPDLIAVLSSQLYLVNLKNAQDYQKIELDNSGVLSRVTHDNQEYIQVSTETQTLLVKFDDKQVTKTISTDSITEVFTLGDTLVGAWKDLNDVQFSNITWISENEGEVIVKSKPTTTTDMPRFSQIRIPKTTPINNISSEELTTSLIERLTTSDNKNIIKLCSSIDNETTIKQTIKSVVFEQTNNCIDKLYSLISSEVSRDCSQSKSLGIWLKWILLTYGGIIAKSDVNLKNLQKELNSGVELLPHLIAIQGRLQLLTLQAEIRQRKVDIEESTETTSDIVYANGEGDDVIVEEVA
ncbi:hypothetical protein JA1_001320 [Spathaspora sp. JA1]|nr:hypothetical protein JA1_001320 [Spathaspora sp. JA1]